VRYDGLTPAELAARIRATSCLVLPTVTSTLDIVHELAAEGAPAGTVVVADEQVMGRGREGRRWLSPPGAGLLLGYLHRARGRGESLAGVLALRVGLAVGAALASLGVEVGLKWPNDVVLRDRKAGGILCEARSVPVGGWVAVGIGLNVRSPVPREVADHAAALGDGRPDLTRVAVLEALLPLLQQLDDGPTLSEAERRGYGARDWLAGRELVEPVAGRVAGIDGDGALVVETGSGMRRVLAGTVVAA
jgi:BirA family transcriptional regulator, biotin operon repressor / biotin---[acetyl-CoA-carboxylase] ligase